MNQTVKSGFASLLLLLPTALIASSVNANPRPLAQTYHYATMAGGEMEVEQYIDIKPIDVIGADGEESTRLQFDLLTELEFGLSDHWELGFYLVGRQPVDDGFQFRGIKQRLRGRFAEEGDLPVDLGVYFEITEYAHELELEQKLIIAKRFGQLMMVANLSIEQEIYYDGGDVEVILNPSAGIAWAPSPAVSLGVEYKLDGEVGELGEADHYLGPVIMLASGEYFATIGAYAHLAGESEGDVLVRILLGIGL